MRLIDADKLIENIENTADLGGWIGDTLRQIKRLAVRYINSAPSIDIDRPQEWIPYSERLPKTHETDGGWKESEKVLTIDDIGVFSVMSYEDDGGSCRYWVDEYGTAAAGVLAWRPLPEPWKGGTE